MLDVKGNHLQRQYTCCYMNATKRLLRFLFRLNTLFVFIVYVSVVFICLPFLSQFCWIFHVCTHNASLFFLLFFCSLYIWTHPNTSCIDSDAIENSRHCFIISLVLSVSHLVFYGFSNLAYLNESSWFCIPFKCGNPCFSGNSLDIRLHSSTFW